MRYQSASLNGYYRNFSAMREINTRDQYARSTREIDVKNLVIHFKDLLLFAINSPAYFHSDVQTRASAHINTHTRIQKRVHANRLLSFRTRAHCRYNYELAQYTVSKVDIVFQSDVAVLCSVQILQMVAR